MMHIVNTPEPMPTDRGAAAADVTSNDYKSNVSTLTERIAIRLAARGAEHAVAAAVTIALRGMSGLEPADFAAELGLAPAQLQALEAGAVAFVELPAAVSNRMLSHNLEPLLLVDLDHQLRGC